MTRMHRAPHLTAVGLAACLPLATVSARALEAQVVRGQVVDSLTRGAVAGAVVTLMSGAAAALDSATADAGGVFLLRAPSAGRYRIRVRHTAYRETLFPSFRLQARDVVTRVLPVSSLTQPGGARGPDVESVLARLCPGGVPAGRPVVAGFVRDAGSEDPVPGARIAVTVPLLPPQVAAPSPGAEGVHPVAAAADGLYAICGAPLGTQIDLYASAGARSSSFVTITFLRNGAWVNGALHPMPSRLWRQDFDLVPGTRHRAAIRGIVTERDGRPARNARITVPGSPYRTRTSRSGAFALDGLPPGYPRLEVTQPGFRPLTRRVRLVDGGTATLTEPGTLVMIPAPLRPGDLAIHGDAPSRNPWIPEFVDRRRRETDGAFLTAGEYEDRWGEPHSLLEFLYAMRGLRAGFAPDTGGDGTFQTTRFARCGQGRYPAYYLDGMFLGWAGETNVDSVVATAWVGAVEAYHDAPVTLRGQGGPPPDVACGAIYLWSRQPVSAGRVPGDSVRGSRDRA